MTEPAQRFYRDLALGDEGDDVARAQQLLIDLGYSIDEEDKRRKRYGQSTSDAVAQMQHDIATNPFQWLRVFIQVLLGGDSESFEALTQTSAEDLEEELVGRDGRPSGGRYRTNAGPEDGLGTGRAVRVSRTEQADAATLANLSQGLGGTNGAHRAAELAQRFVGQRESAGNTGAIVRMSNGYTGDPWCGGFVHYLFNQTAPGLYDQSSFRSARSYMAEGREHNAFRPRGSAYHPQVGDAIVFSRGNDPSKGHVGIVVGYDEATRELRYVSGNDGNTVRERTIDLDTPPQRLLGFTDSHALARAKGIDLGVVAAPERVAPVVRPAAPIRANPVSKDDGDDAPQRSPLPARVKLPDGLVRLPTPRDVREGIDDISENAQKAAGNALRVGRSALVGLGIRLG